MNYKLSTDKIAYRQYMIIMAYPAGNATYHNTARNYAVLDIGSIIASGSLKTHFGHEEVEGTEIF